ncbi:MAG: RDD family protein [Bdellovibrionota bacterium]
MSDRVEEATPGASANVNPLGNRKKADFGVRILAFIIDALCLALASGIVAFFLGTVGVVLSFFMPVLYNGYFYQKYSSTPGKKFFHLEVIKVGSGAKPTYMDAFLRDAVGKTLSAMIFFIGYIMAAFREDGQALHDLIAKTVVVQKS